MTQLEAAVRDVLAMERTAQEQTRVLSVTHRELVASGGQAITPEQRGGMDAIMADAAERMADRLREVMPDA